MSANNWNALLPSGQEQISAATDGQLSEIGEACQQYATTLCLGISAIGNLLACTASNGTTGLSTEAAIDLGWMLQAVGDLSAQLVDTGFSAEFECQQRRGNQ